MEEQLTMQFEDKKDEKFWRERAIHYDKLFWTKDEEYLDTIITMSDLQPHDLVLDVGIGTGTVAKKIRPRVKNVIGVDISDSMLSQIQKEDISLIKWNICDALFTNNIFDKVFARMVLHHIVDSLDVALLRCYDLLRNGGKIIVAEGVPPTDDPQVIAWYSNMFKLKEDRLTFTKQELIALLEKIGFQNVQSQTYIMKNFSIKNWLKNSGLDQAQQEKIMDVHRTADETIQHAYNMHYVNEDCLVDTKNVILVGEK